MAVPSGRPDLTHVSMLRTNERRNRACTIQARETFATIVDCLRDHNDVRECYSMTQKHDFDCDLDALLKTLDAERAVIGAGIRRTRVRFKSGGEPMDWSNIYFILANQGALPSSIRVPKQFTLG
jgi:hypothetical protein